MKKSVLMPIIAVFCLVMNFSSQAAQYCEVYFPDSAQGHADGSQLKIIDNGQVFNDDDNTLTFSDDSDSDPDLSSCGTSDCSITNTNAPAISLPDFPSFDSNSNNTLNNENTTLRSSSKAEYKSLQIKGSSQITMTADGADFIIESAKFYGTSQVTLNPGVYWFDTLEIYDEANIVITGPVTIYTLDKFQISGNAMLNATGDAKNLVIISQHHVHFQGDSTSKAVAYSTDHVRVEGDAVLTGTVSVGDKFELKDDGKFYYESPNGLEIGGVDCSSLGIAHEYHFDSCRAVSSFPDMANSSGATDTTNFGLLKPVAGILENAVNLSVLSEEDYFSIPKQTMNGLSDLTFSIWVNAPVSKEEQHIIQALGSDGDDDPEDDSDEEFQIYLNYDKQIRMRVNDDSFSLPSSTEITGSGWHQIVITRQDDNVCLFVDAILESCEAGVSADPLAIKSAIILGQEQDKVGGSFSSSQSFEGYLDELRIHNRLLSNDEILNAYANEVAGKQYDGQTRTPLNCPAQYAELIADYHFDECLIEDSLEDFSDNLYHATPYQVDSTELAPVGRGIDLTAEGNDDWVMIPNQVFHGLNDFNVSLWFKTDKVRGQMQLLHALGDDTGDDEIEMYLDTQGDNRFSVKFFDSGSMKFDAGAIDLNDNQWHQVILTRQESELCLYLDGELLGTCRNVGLKSVNTPNVSSIVLGQEQDSFGGGFESDQSFIGYLDEFKVIAGTLTAEQLQNLYAYENAGKSWQGNERLINCDIPVGECAGVFIDGITTTASGNIIFDDDSQLYDNPDAVLAAASVNDKPGCNGQLCGLDAPIIGFDSQFPVFSGGSTIEYKTGTSTINVTDPDTYNEIKVKEGAQLYINADSEQNSYYINKLKVEKAGELFLSPGNYYISELEIKGEGGNKPEEKSFLHVSGVGDGTGTVRIFTDKKAKFKEYSEINGIDGDPEKLFIYHIADTNDAESLKLESNAQVSAYIYSAKKVEIKGDSQIYGAVSSEDEIKFHAGSGDVHYRADNLNDTNFGEQCEDIISPIDHFEVIHDGNGLTCDAEAIIIKACADDAVPCENLSATPVNLDLVLSPINGDNQSYNVNLLGREEVNIRYPIADTLTLSLANASEGASNSTEFINRSGGSANQIVFSDAGFKFSTLAGDESIPTQIAGVPFNVLITSVKNNNGVCEAFVSNADEISMAQLNVNPGGTSGLKFTVDGNELSKDSSTPTPGIEVNFDDGTHAQGSTVLGSPTYFDAGQISLYASLTTNLGYGDVTLVGHSQPFWVRPDRLAIEVLSNIDGVAAPDNDGVYVAGNEFTLNVKALNRQNGVTKNYKAEQIQLNLHRTLPTGDNTYEGTLSYADNGTLASNVLSPPVFSDASLTDFVEGVSSYEQAQYSEVGVVDFTVKDSAYPCSDSGSCIAEGSVTLGRFIPQKFVLTDNEVTQGCSDFSYLGQGFATDFTMQALNSDGDITKNYSGNAPDVQVYTLDSPATDYALNTGLTSRLDINDFPSWENGEFALFSADIPNSTLARASSPDGPFLQSNLVLQVSDADGVNFANYLDEAQTQETINTSNLDFRYGRLRMLNNYGPVGSDLSIPMQVEYWDSAAANFKINILDSCSSYDPLNISSDSSEDILGNADQFTQGKYPLAGDLFYSSPVTPKTVNLESTAPVYLMFNWLNDGVERIPFSTLIFGVSNHNRRVISKREVQ